MFASIAYAAEEVATAVAPAVTIGAAWDQLISTVILSILGLVTTTVLPYAVVLARSWFKAKIAKIKSDELRAAADFAMQRLDHIVCNVVKEIQQTKLTGEQQLTKEQGKQLLTAAYNRVKTQVTADILETVKTVVNDPDRYLITKIEAAVGELKQAKCLKPPPDGR